MRAAASNKQQRSHWASPGVLPPALKSSRDWARPGTVLVWCGISSGQVRQPGSAIAKKVRLRFSAQVGAPQNPGPPLWQDCGKRPGRISGAGDAAGQFGGQPGGFFEQTAGTQRVLFLKRRARFRDEGLDAVVVLGVLRVEFAAIDWSQTMLDLTQAVFDFVAFGRGLARGDYGGGRRRRLLRGRGWSRKRSRSVSMTPAPALLHFGRWRGGRGGRQGRTGRGRQLRGRRRMAGNEQRFAGRKGHKRRPKEYGRNPDQFHSR